MIVQCPKCNKKYEIDETHLPKGAVKVRGPTCKHVWTIEMGAAKLGQKPKAGEETGDLFQRGESDTTVYHKLLPIEDLVTIRAIVGYLGEKPQFGWWDTNYFKKTDLPVRKKVLQERLYA
jgi:predicted Zn finger-like uncharacterized protein